MPPDFGIGLCVWVCGPIFQVRLNFSADDRGTKDYREEEEEGRDRLSQMCQRDKKKKDNKTKRKSKRNQKEKKNIKRKKDKGQLRGGGGVRGGRVSEKCSEQGSERNQIRETIMVELMGTRNIYLSMYYSQTLPEVLHLIGLSYRNDLQRLRIASEHIQYRSRETGLNKDHMNAITEKQNSKSIAQKMGI